LISEFSYWFIEQNNLLLMTSRCYDVKEGFLMTNSRVINSPHLMGAGGPQHCQATSTRKSSQHIIAQLDPKFIAGNLFPGY
jgi:hypothetical protein